MNPFLLAPHTYATLIKQGLFEDIGYGDLTSNVFIAMDAQATMRMVARDTMVVCGAEIARDVFKAMDVTLEIDLLVPDATYVEAGTALLQISGNARSILGAERTALNFMSYLSGIATQTQHCVKALEGTTTVLLDTRKTLPAYRTLSKYAVRCGGGRNHRIRLDDGVMIKDNHIALMGSLQSAIAHARRHVPVLTKIEVECDTLLQVEQALHCEVDMILLDNMSVEQVAQAVALAAGRIPLEASGGMTLETIRAYAQTGVNYISMGALTHSVTNADIGLDYI